MLRIFMKLETRNMKQKYSYFVFHTSYIFAYGVSI